MKTLGIWIIFTSIFISIFIVIGLVYFEVPSKIEDSITSSNIEINYLTEKVPQYGEGSCIIEPQVGYTFLKVDLFVQNNGYDEFYSGCLSDLSLNADNLEYDYCSRVSHNNYNFLPATLLKGGSWNGTIVYEIPVNTSDYYLDANSLTDFKTELNCLD
jgi:hypothetical protein